MRFLVEKCCKEFAPDDWTYLNGMEDEDFASQLRDADVAAVPYVLHDFAMQPNLDERPQEPFEGPLMLRRALANRGLLFPLFDFACVWRMYKTGQLSANSVRVRYPSEEAGVITALVGVIQSVPALSLGSSVLALFTKRLGNRLTLWRHGRNIGEDELDAIQRMNPASDLLEALPALLAKDLTASLSLPEAPRRLVLAFDTHEAFWVAPRTSRSTNASGTSGSGPFSEISICTRGSSRSSPAASCRGGAIYPRAEFQMNIWSRGRSGTCPRRTR